MNQKNIVNFINDNLNKLNDLSKKECKLQNKIFLFKGIVQFFDRMSSIFQKTVILSGLSILLGMLMLIISSISILLGIGIFLIDIPLTVLVVSFGMFMFNGIIELLSLAGYIRSSIKLVGHQYRLEIIEAIVKVRCSLGKYLINPSVDNLKILKKNILSFSSFKNKEYHGSYLDCDLKQTIEFISQYDFNLKDDNECFDGQVQTMISKIYDQPTRERENPKSLGQKTIRGRKYE